MNCEEATKLMDGYLDSELDPITSQKIEQHLRECPKCDQAYNIHGSLIRVIGNATPYYKAPAELREQIQSSLRDAVGAKDKGGSGQPGQLSVPRPQGERSRPFSGSMELAGFGSSYNVRRAYHCSFPASNARAQCRSVSRDTTYS